MTEDNKVVQPEKPVPAVEPVSPTAAPEPTPQPAVAPVLSPEQEAKVQELVAQATTKAVEEARKSGRQELQSQQDKNKAELERIERRATTAEASLGATTKQLQSLDPEVAKEVELAQLRAREAARTTQDQAGAVKQQQETVFASLETHLKSLGIDPKDPRIDWALGTNSIVEGRGIFDASVAQIINETKKTAESGFEQRLKDLEAKIGQANIANIEANSVATTPSPGVVAGSDAEFLKLFGSGTIVQSEEADRQRYDKIMKTYE